MTVNPETSPSEQERLVEAEVEKLEIFCDVANLFDTLDSARRMVAWLVETPEGIIVWNHVVRPEGECSIADDYGDGRWFYQSQIDALLAYANRERRLTGDSIATIFSVSPLDRYLTACGEALVVQEERLRFDGQPVGSETCRYSAVIIQSANTPHSARVTFTYSSVTVESSSPGRETVTHSLQPATCQVFRWQLLGFLVHHVDTTHYHG